MPEPPTGEPRTTVTVLTSQLQALREAFGEDVSDDELYSAAAIAVLLYLPGRRRAAELEDRLELDSRAHGSGTGVSL
jgi:hypothetical protein